MDRTSTQAIDHTGAASWSNGEGHYFLAASSPAMREVEQIIANVAPTDFPLLLMGESGVGKEAVASHIHRHSLRSDKSFTKIICGALTPESFETLRRESESENGHGRSSKIGTLFLDEITDLASPCQAGLLQAFPDGEINPLGHFLSARIISTTTKSPEELEQMLDRGSLRRDLFYRLKGVCLRLPPLRERKEDIAALAEFLLRKNASQLGRPQPSISARALQILQEYPWPGNIRELENVVKKIVALGSDSAVSDLEPSNPGTRSSHGNIENLSLKQAARAASRQVEKEMILRVLTRTHWNRKRAAQHLQISYKALLYKLRQMGLDESGTL
ncbi:MAG TPA: sigma 54-interacting transcriptional regulator [Terriglobia bacterium]|nr:sigma 54-interacting transcriptional regulator [Terriglobia bacterium]